MRNTSRPGTRPVRLGRALASTALGLALLSAIPAQGHPADLMKPDRAGPIVRGDATLRDLRRWFGPPTARKQVRVGCERVVSARWGGGLRVYASREAADRPRDLRGEPAHRQRRARGAADAHAEGSARGEPRSATPAPVPGSPGRHPRRPHALPDRHGTGRRLPAGEGQGGTGRATRGVAFRVLLSRSAVTTGDRARRRGASDRGRL
jgi:hypothetical protein